MIIIILLIYILNKLIKKIFKKIKGNFLYITIIGIIIHVLLFILYRYNLFLLGREVYYSDAEIYWKNTIDYYYGNIYYAYNQTYIYISLLIQKFSPFIWVGWNNIFNILAVDLSIIILTIYTYNNIQEKQGEEGARSTSKKLFSLLWFNPLIYYSLMRNLKDASYLIIIITLALFLEYMIKNENKKIIKLIIFILINIIFSYILLNIRPWAFFSGFVALYLYVKKIYGKKSIIVSIIILGIVILLFFIFIPGIRNTILLWWPIILSKYKQLSIISIFNGMLKLLIGPGPIRSIMGKKYFQYYTDIGNIASTVGSTMWWLCLSDFIYLIIKNIKKKKKINEIEEYYIYTVLFYILIYAIAYGGSAELRFRGTLYPLITFILLNIEDFTYGEKDTFISKIVIFVIIVVGGIIYGR